MSVREVELRAAPLRSGLARLVARGQAGLWQQEARPLLELTAVSDLMKEHRSEDAAEALFDVLRAAVRKLGPSQDERLLTVVLGLEPHYAGLSAQERRTIAGREFRGGQDQVTAGTIRQHHEPRALERLAQALVADETERVTARDDTAEDDEHPQLIEWHPAVHERWAHERLSFWRLGFSVYRGSSVTTAISTLMKQAGVRSWSLYELLGRDDVLLRAWLPELVEDFETLLAIALHEEGGLRIERFAVTEVMRHWPWNARAKGVLSQPEPGLFDAAKGTLAELITRLQVDGRIEPDRHALSHAVNAHLAQPIRTGRGIAVAIVIDAPRHPLTVEADAALRRMLLDLIDRQDILEEVSLYKGYGFCRYLLQGCVVPERFSNLRGVLLGPLTELSELAECRTTTSVLATPDPVARHESMPVRAGSDAAVTISADELLSGEEDQRLEVKASAFHDINGWLAGTRDDTPPSHAPLNALLATIVGMLNADGGTIIVGAAERRRVHNESLTASMPQRGDWVICGVNDEAEDGLDQYERKLAEAIRRSIEPSPLTYLTTQFEQVGDRSVCVIRVRRPDSGWFYVSTGRQSRFFVRHHTRTVEIAGPDQDQYKQMRSEAPT